jgi:hypothetical protein
MRRSWCIAPSPINLVASNGKILQSAICSHRRDDFQLISGNFESTHVSLTVKVEAESLIHVSQSGTVGCTVETNVSPAQFNSAANSPIQQRARNLTACIPAADGQTMDKDGIALD